MFALPVVVPLIALGIVLLTGDPVAAATRLVDPDVLALLLVVQAGLLGWRLLAVGSSVRAVELPSPRPVDRLVVALLVAIVVLPQAALAYATAVARGVGTDLRAGRQPERLGSPERLTRWRY